jgi:hypothetical protein
MLNIHRNKLSKQQQCQLLVYHTLKILRKKNKSFYSCFTLNLPVNGVIKEKDFICLLRKFLRKIQVNQLYISVFEFNEKTQQLQVKIVISAIYSKYQIATLRQLWANILIKQNLLLTLRDVENCFEYRSINNIFSHLSDLFRLEQSKKNISVVLGMLDGPNNWFPGIFYGSNVFGDILYKLRILLLQEHAAELRQRRRDNFKQR